MKKNIIIRKTPRQWLKYFNNLGLYFRTFFWKFDYPNTFEKKLLKKKMTEAEFHKLYNAG